MRTWQELSMSHPFNISTVKLFQVHIGLKLIRLEQLEEEKTKIAFKGITQRAAARMIFASGFNNKVPTMRNKMNTRTSANLTTEKLKD